MEYLNSYFLPSQLTSEGLVHEFSTVEKSLSPGHFPINNLCWKHKMKKLHFVGCGYSPSLMP